MFLLNEGSHPMYKKKPRNEATCLRLPYVLLLTAAVSYLPYSSSRWSYLLTLQTKRGNYFFLSLICYRPRPYLYAGSSIFSGPTQPSLMGGPYTLRSLGMPICNHQSRFCRQACWMCPAWGPWDEVQAIAGGDMLYLLPSFVGNGIYGWQYVRVCSFYYLN